MAVFIIPLDPHLLFLFKTFAWSALFFTVSALNVAYRKCEVALFIHMFQIYSLKKCIWKPEKLSFPSVALVSRVVLFQIEC